MIHKLFWYRIFAVSILLSFLFFPDSLTFSKCEIFEKSLRLSEFRKLKTIRGLVIILISWSHTGLKSSGIFIFILRKTSFCEPLNWNFRNWIKILILWRRVSLCWWKKSLKFWNKKFCLCRFSKFSRMCWIGEWDKIRIQILFC